MKTFSRSFADSVPTYGLILKRAFVLREAVLQRDFACCVKTQLLVNADTQKFHTQSRLNTYISNVNVTEIFHWNTK